MASRPKLPAIDEASQAARILKSLSNWCTAAPNRRVVITFGAEGWRVELDESTRTSGGSITDALAQASSIVNFEGAR